MTDLNEYICPKSEYCNVLKKSGSSKSYMFVFLLVVSIVFVRTILFTILFYGGFLPFYYLWFPLFVFLQIALLIIEFAVLFRFTGIYCLFMLLHLLFFVPFLALFSFIPWSIVALVVYAILTPEVQYRPT